MPDQTSITQETAETPIVQDTPVNMGSSTPDTPPEAVNAPINADTPVQVNNDNQGVNSPESPSENEGISAENPPIEPNPEPVNPEPVSVPASSEAGTGQIPVSDPLPISTKPSQKDLWKRFLDKVQIRKRRKLEKIMTLFLKQSKITNDEVEKFLYVSDKTVERYLNILEKENRIKRVGKTGHAVNYIKI